MTIGEIIYSKRKALGLTLEAVGQAVGVSKATVSRWESGDIRHMRRDKIQALSNLLEIEPALFIMTSEIITQSERELIEAYRAADDRARADALATLKSHAKAESPSAS